MANALSYGMPQQENPLSPIPSAPTFGMKQPQQTGAMNAVMPSKKANALAMKGSQMAPPPMPQKQKMQQRPMTSASPNALAMAFGSQQQKPDAMYAFMDTLQRTIDPAAAQARETRLTEQQQQKLGQGLAFIQQMRAIPEDQRMAMAQQGIGQFGLGNIQIPEGGLTDAELDKGIATLSAQLGQGPTPREYQALQGPDGSINRFDKSTGTIEELRAPTPKQQPTNLDRAVGANGNFWTFDPASGDMKDTGVPAPPGEAGKTNMDKIQDAAGNWYYVDPETRETFPIGIRGRVPGADGGGSGDTYRPATPEDLIAWGIPRGTPVKINNRTGEPEVISGAKPASEYNQTEIRAFRDKADGLYILDNAINQYVETLERMGGPQLLDTPLNAENVQAIRSAHGLITAAMKQAEALGALDAGVQNLVNSIISDPVGWATIGKSTDSIKAQAAEIGKGIQFKLSRIPEEYRYGSTGAAPPPATPNQPQAAQAPQYTPDEVQKAQAALQNFNMLPQNLQTPEMRARLEAVVASAQPQRAPAPPKQPTAADMGDDELRAMLGL